MSPTASDLTELVIDARPRDLGGGLTVNRLLPYAKRRMIGPFIFFDHMGPIDLAPGFPRALDVRPHPHIGLSTVTYLFDGALTHRDSLGSHRIIRPHQVNWMTAGSGITHSERLEDLRAHGGRLNGIQAWVALPSEEEERAPSFSHHEGTFELPEFVEHNTSGRLLAGSFHGLQSTVPTHSPLFYVHLHLAPGAVFDLDAPFAERGIYLADGAITLNERPLTAGQLVALEPRKAYRATAHTPATLMFFGGEALGPRFISWNFVSSSQARIEAAAAAWRAQTMLLPPDDSSEFTPLPDFP